MSDSESLRLARALLGTLVSVTMDRPLGSLHPKHGFRYEVNYGFVEGVKAPDGEDLDAYFLGVSEPMQAGAGRAIAIVHRLDEDDDKLVVVPDGTTLSDIEIERMVAFQEQWFTHEILRS